MPRHYVKKTKQYTEDELASAINDIMQHKLGVREAARKYGIDKSLLSRRILQQAMGTQGWKPVFGSQHEKCLADNLRIMAKWGFALTKKEVTGVVKGFVETNNISNPFRNNTPGNDWFDAFCRRHNLNVKKLEPLENNRRKATSDPYLIYGFYDLVESSIESLGLKEKPECVWNLDETYFCSDPTRCRYIAGVGQKAHRNIQGSGKENTSVLACCSAAGRVLPPLIIYQSVNLWSTWKGENDLPGTFYSNSEKGYMTSCIFNSFMRKFAEVVTERPILLIFDGHLSHLDIATLEFAKQNMITILKFPAHTTDLLQPLDKCCFGPLKQKWSETVNKWQNENQRLPSKSEFADLLCSIWHSGLSTTNVISGFGSSGIFPPNKEKYPTERFNPVVLEHYLAEKQSSAPTSHRAQSPSTLAPGPSEREQFHGPPTTPAVSNMPPDTTALSLTPTSTSNSRPTCEDGPTNMPASFERLLLGRLGKTRPPSATRRRIDPSSKVVTSAEYIKEIKAKQANPKKGRNITTGCKRRKNIEDEETTSHSDTTDWEGSSTDDSDSDGEDFLQPEPYKSVEEIQKGHFVLVRFQGGKRKMSQFRYVCVIENVLDGNDVQVLGMRYMGSKDTFIFKENDVSVVNSHDVIGRLQEPTTVQFGARMKFLFPLPVDVCQV